MKFKKVLFSIFMMFLSTLVVYADAPDSITINGSNLTMLSAATYLPNYNEEGLNVTLKQTTDGKITYCINPNRDLYTGVMTYNKGNEITDSRVLGVLVNGYNYGMNTGNSGKDYFITNLALWTIVEPSSYKLQGVNCNANTYNGTSSTTVASACALATQTYTPPTSSISVNSSNVNMTLSGDYYVTSSAIGVNLSSNATSYTVTLGSGAPTGAVVTDSAGNTKTTFNKGESFKVKVPKSSVTSTTSFGVTITATYQDYAAYEYNPTAGNSYQSVALLVTESSTKSANLTLNITVEAPTPTTTTIKVFKYIYGTTTPLSGASFTLINSSGSTVDTWGTTNSNPHTIANLSDGAYTLREYAVPNGYEVDNINSVIVVNNGSVRVTQGNAVASGTSIIIYNKPEQQEAKFSVRVIKADFNYEVLSGASFELRDSQNGLVEHWTSDTNAHTTGLLSPGVYTLYEVLPPSGYMATGPISFRLGTDGSVVNTSNNSVYPNGIITVFNDLIPEQVFSITLVKRDAAVTSTLLSGAVFKLQKAGETARTLSFNTNTSITVSNLTVGTYTLTEETAPSGYVKLVNAITFNISSTGTITNLSGAGATLINNKQIAVDNSKVTTTIKITKRDASNTSKLLPYAEFTLKNNDTNTTQNLTFGNNTSITVSNLIPGSYTLTETKAPDGYIKLTNSITFRINAAGEITNLSGGGVTSIDSKHIAVNNKKVQITIIKKNEVTNADLTGAKFKLKKTDAPISEETLTFTAASIVKNLGPGTYTLTEIEAPDGYELDATPYVFKISSTGVVTNNSGTVITGGKIIRYNAKEPVAGEVVISKRDVTTGEELPGATLELYKDNKKITDWVSEDTPKVIPDLEPGTYTLKETIAPEGYELSTETVSFTIGEDGKVVGGVVVMTNTPKKVVGKVVISKIDATTSKELPGATLTIKDSNGDVVDRWTSTSTPHTVSLEPGTYTLTEVSAPKKYILNKEVITFTVGEDGTVSGKVVMKNYPDEVKENAQTGATIWIIVIIAGLLSLGYAIFIFLRNNKNKSQV